MGRSGVNSAKASVMDDRIHCIRLCQRTAGLLSLYASIFDLSPSPTCVPRSPSDALPSARVPDPMHSWKGSGLLRGYWRWPMLRKSYRPCLRRQSETKDGS